MQSGNRTTEGFLCPRPETVSVARFTGSTDLTPSLPSIQMLGYFQSSASRTATSRHFVFSDRLPKRAVNEISNRTNALFENPRDPRALPSPGLE